MMCLRKPGKVIAPDDPPSTTVVTPHWQSDWPAETDFPGVQIPDYLRERYPGEMTIVLQYQFENLTVDEVTMGVTLSFNNIPERLVVPLAAITIFADPSVNFALQFQPLGDLHDSDDGLGHLTDDPDDDGSSPKGKKSKAKAEETTGEVISLDKFRKK